MPNPENRRISYLVHDRTDLPRPLGLDVRRNGQLDVYLTDLSSFEAWRGALDGAGDVQTGNGFRYVAGWLVFGERKALTTLLVRLDQEGTKQ